MISFRQFLVNLLAVVIIVAVVWVLMSIGASFVRWELTTITSTAVGRTLFMVGIYLGTRYLTGGSNADD